MAGPGGRPPRKSHTKSRKGCKTCKRRHIRCDETMPQCRNCTKHNCRCDYMDNVLAHDAANNARSPDLLMSPEIELEIQNWQKSGNPPFPELQLSTRAYWYKFSRTDLRLIHHIAGLSIDLHRRGYSNCTVWAQKMPIFLTIALSNDFVMSSILALSASHIAWMTQNQDTENLAYHHRGVAIKGLQEAISSFSRENSDAILASSLLLSWQSTEWITDLLAFTQRLRDELPVQSPEKAFERLQPLRIWLFWLPSAMLRGGETDLGALSVLSQFFGVALALEPLFPEFGGSYLGSMAVNPIEEIRRILYHRRAANPFAPEIQLALSLMDLPAETVAEYRSRLQWSPRSSFDGYPTGSHSPYHHALPTPHLPHLPATSAAMVSSTTTAYPAYTTSPLHSPMTPAIVGSPYQMSNAMLHSRRHSQVYPSPTLHHDPVEDRMPEYKQPEHPAMFNPAYLGNLINGGPTIGTEYHDSPPVTVTGGHFSSSFPPAFPHRLAIVHKSSIRRSPKITGKNGPAEVHVLTSFLLGISRHHHLHPQRHRDSSSSTNIATPPTSAPRPTNTF
ncbi:Zn(2)-C6 fungal-type DNA-binding domain [Trichophyton rubrum]|nr:Zn(2)-C6 fungal-type DNA-binding domain [Trichophyton rubrum]